MHPLVKRFALTLPVGGLIMMTTAHGQDWPWWRGPGRDGHSLGDDAPLTWSERDNVAWKVSVPGRGHSSPVVVSNRVFLTTADEQEQLQLALCFDRQSGRLLWRTAVHRGGFMPRHRENSYASATPACDGERVFVVFQNREALWITALDLDSKQVWQKRVGPYDLRPDNEGYGSSPVLHQSLVIINGDNRREGFLAAFDAETGELIWRRARRSEGSFGSPVVATVAERPQLLLSGTGWVDSYDPATGQPIWTCRGTAAATANSVAFSDSHVFASGGAPQREMLCVRANGEGDVTKTHLVWKTSRGVTYVPSPLYHSGRLYVVNDSGIARSIDAISGRHLWEHRLEGSFKASPVVQEDRIYAVNESGKTLVFRAHDDFELLAENVLDEGAFATPSICGGEIYLRTFGHLYRIEEAGGKEGP